MKALLFKAGKQYLQDAAEVIDVDGKFDTYYDLIGCRIVQYLSCKIGGKYFDIVCDEEGFLKQNPILSASCRNIKHGLVGNLIVLGRSDENGENVSISSEDVELILNNARSAVRGTESICVLTYTL